MLHQHSILRYFNSSTFLLFFIGHQTLSIHASFSESTPKFPPSFNSLASNLKQRLQIEGEALDPFLDEKETKGIDLNASTNPQVAYIAPGQFWDVATSFSPFLFRAGSGSFVEGYGITLTEKDETSYSFATFGKYQLKETCSDTLAAKAPFLPLEIYEFEGCPFCRKVREAVSILSLEVYFKPCPMDGRRFRQEVKSRFGSEARFPFMIDPNNDIAMFESDDIVAYLFNTYGDGKVPWTLSGGIATTLTSSFGLIPRLGNGGKYKLAITAPKPLVLWSGEGSPFCKIVKEVLCEFELGHIQISCPRGSTNRQKMFEKKGLFQVPFLEDPNTGVELFESAAIVEYLVKEYGIKPSPVQYI
mmetsp:Transcript_51032/g.75749  ORF Transcript_51032/g.75749 Transcript_51032/m.75749 type:complete len:359 (-) Transcript_51032:161-1237(-)